jgi:hypothetical protein
MILMRELDNFSNLESPKMDIWEAITWWEKKRLLYNIVVNGIAIGRIFFELSKFNTLFTQSHFPWLPIIFIVIQFFILANFCFCSGYVLEILEFYYLKKIGILKPRRWGILILGYMISIPISYLLWDIIFSIYSHYFY